MNCHCCARRMRSGRRVKLRRWRDYDPSCGGPDSPAYRTYCEEMTYRWAVICQACYSALDNVFGLAEVAGVPYNLAGASRGDKATTIDEEKYLAGRKKEAARRGIALWDGG